MAQAVNGMAIEWVGTDSIAPAEWNVRTGHDVDGIAESIIENGFRDPIEVWRDTGEIVRGNGTWKAAKLLGLDMVPIIRHDFADLAAAKRYAIAHNRLGDKSEFDLPALEAQLAELDSLAGTGFSDEALGGFGDGHGGATTPDEFREYDEDIETEHRCPKCGYTWSGKSA